MAGSGKIRKNIYWHEFSRRAHRRWRCPSWSAAPIVRIRSLHASRSTHSAGIAVAPKARRPVGLSPPRPYRHRCRDWPRSAPHRESPAPAPATITRPPVCGPHILMNECRSGIFPPTNCGRWPQHRRPPASRCTLANSFAASATSGDDTATVGPSRASSGAAARVAAPSMPPTICGTENCSTKQRPATLRSGHAARCSLRPCFAAMPASRRVVPTGTVARTSRRSSSRAAATMASAPASTFPSSGAPSVSTGVGTTRMNARGRSAGAIVSVKASRPAPTAVASASPRPSSIRPTRRARSAASRAGSVSTPSTSQPRAANAVASGSPIAPHPTTTICGVSVTGRRVGDGSNTGSKRDSWRARVRISKCPRRNLKQVSRAKAQNWRDRCEPRSTFRIGAGEGNRTLVISLEGFCSTIELRPHHATHRTPLAWLASRAGEPAQAGGGSRTRTYEG